MLDAYEKILRVDEKAGSKKLNGMLALRDKGELGAEFQKRWAKECNN